MRETEDFITRWLKYFKKLIHIINKINSILTYMAIKKNGRKYINILNEENI